MKEKMAAAMDKKLELEAKTAGVKVVKKKQSVYSKQKGQSPNMRGDPDGIDETDGEDDESETIRSSQTITP